MVFFVWMGMIGFAFTNEAQVLTWDGTVNGDWDIGVTANWQTNAYYTQNNGIGPEVVFNDTAHGPYIDIILINTFTEVL